MPSPTSVRFDHDVLRRLSAYVAVHPGSSISSATNQLLDEALRTAEHPLVMFQDGPSGRRARLVSGPDVWQVVRAVQSARAAEPELLGTEIIKLVADTTGVPTRLVEAAVSYWAAFNAEIDAMIELAEADERRAHEQWQRQRDLLAG